MATTSGYLSSTTTVLTWVTPTLTLSIYQNLTSPALPTNIVCDHNLNIIDGLPDSVTVGTVSNVTIPVLASCCGSGAIDIYQQGTNCSALCHTEANNNVYNVWECIEHSPDPIPSDWPGWGFSGCSSGQRDNCGNTDIRPPLQTTTSSTATSSTSSATVSKSATPSNTASTMHSVSKTEWFLTAMTVLSLCIGAAL